MAWLAYLLFTWEGGKFCKSDDKEPNELDLDEKGELMEVTTA